MQHNTQRGKVTNDRHRRRLDCSDCSSRGLLFTSAAQICDFGLARGVKEEVDYELTEYVVTRWYRAPEVGNLAQSRHWMRQIGGDRSGVLCIQSHKRVCSLACLMRCLLLLGDVLVPRIRPQDRCVVDWVGGGAHARRDDSSATWDSQTTALLCLACLLMFACFRSVFVLCVRSAASLPSCTVASLCSPVTTTSSR
jgi:serine/threonine protein kinase